jgi:hypothetical protein
VKKLLDTVPDRLYPAVALSRLKAFDERSRRRSQAGGE